MDDGAGAGPDTEEGGTNGYGRASVTAPVREEGAVTVDRFGQAPFPCRFLWGPEGARLAGDRGDIVVIVDTFSFSTATTVAVSRGAAVCATLSPEDAAAQAQTTPRAIVLPGRSHPTPEGWSHSPASLRTLPAGMRLIFFSPNGGHCCALVQRAAALLVGGVVNASSVATAALGLHHALGLPVTVVACGERWDGDGSLRPCLEDELGAGAVLSAMGLEPSPEAGAAARLFDVLRGSLAELLWDCGSGRELRERGFPDDVRLMSELDHVQAVPVRGPDGWLRDAGYAVR